MFSFPLRTPLFEVAAEKSRAGRKKFALEMHRAAPPRRCSSWHKIFSVGRKRTLDFSAPRTASALYPFTGPKTLFWTCPPARGSFPLRQLILSPLVMFAGSLWVLSSRLYLHVEIKISNVKQFPKNGDPMRQNLSHCHFKSQYDNKNDAIIAISRLTMCQKIKKGGIIYAK